MMNEYAILITHEVVVEFMAFPHIYYVTQIPGHAMDEWGIQIFHLSRREFFDQRGKVNQQVSTNVHSKNIFHFGHCRV